MRQIQRDVDDFVKNFKHSHLLANTTVCITGATGFIGSMITRCLLALKCDIKVVIPVRNKDKVPTDIKHSNCLVVIEVEDLVSWTTHNDMVFDYIIHCASPTSGEYMVKQPVETFHLIYQTMYNILENTKTHGSKGVVFLSSVEAYGQIMDKDTLEEMDLGYIDMTNPRSCYPLAKQAGEYLCRMYAYEYGVPVKIARLTQTFGAGISKSDYRVFAQFANSIVRGEDIILHTSGESSKPYCYSIDCVLAIMQIILFGENGETYNVANKRTYISIKDLALFLRQSFNSSINVVHRNQNETCYAPITKLHLSTDKIEKLGWKPMYDLEEMFKRLINYIKEESYG